MTTWSPGGRATATACGVHHPTTSAPDPVTLRGQARYDALVALCRRLGVHTPEDPYPLWPGPDGPVVVAPLFLLYDYTFRPPGADGKAAALAAAEAAGVMCTDEVVLHP